MLLAVLLMLFRRPPALLLLRPVLADVRCRADALFLGRFGPVGVGAVFYAGLAERRLGHPLVRDVVSLVVCASTVARGMTAAPLTRVYGRRTGRSVGRAPPSPAPAVSGRDHEPSQ